MILLSNGASIAIFIGMVIIIALIVTYLMRGAIQDIRGHNLEKYLTFSDVIPKNAFVRFIKKNIKRASDNETFSIVYVAIDKISDLEAGLSQRIIIEILKSIIEKIRNVFSSETVISAVHKGEFYLYVSNQYKYDEVMELVYSLFDQLSKPFVVANQTNIKVNMSIVAAFYPIHGDTAGELIKVLNNIMRDIREEGGSAVRTLQSDSGISKSSYFDYYHEIKKAIEEDQFEFYYQPAVDVRDNKVVNVSLYLRWNQPELGVLTAGKFYKVLEQSGNIYFVGLHGLEMMCKQYDYLTRMFNNENLLLKLLVSGREFSNKNLIQDFKKILKKHKRSPDRFVLDVPVDLLLLDQKDPVSSKIAELRKMGFKFATDVYALNLFDLEKIVNSKLDILTLSRSFLEKQDNNALDVYFKVFNQTVNADNIMIIGEQVETEQELKFYQKNNINIIQGYYISKVMPFYEIESWMNIFSGKSILTKAKPSKDEKDKEETKKKIVKEKESTESSTEELKPQEKKKKTVKKNEKPQEKEVKE